MKYLIYNGNLEKYSKYIEDNNLNPSMVFYCWTIEEAKETELENRKWNIKCKLIDLGIE